MSQLLKIIKETKRSFYFRLKTFWKILLLQRYFYEEIETKYYLSLYMASHAKQCYALDLILLLILLRLTFESSN